ncbi:hypothetical protein EYF80_041828 [Liparis tanakae]|uniref:Uncharacterized protein n=1 Tax=Liparis tanakae TaxID=230148 RepID=A0A4Z2G324_9TELE|nr:hypothetical protein EYF80_041828 [Liparis tanakae]
MTSCVYLGAVVPDGFVLLLAFLLPYARTTSGQVMPSTKYRVELTESFTSVGPNVVLEVSSSLRIALSKVMWVSASSVHCSWLATAAQKSSKRNGESRSTEPKLRRTS